MLETRLCARSRYLIERLSEAGSVVLIVVCFAGENGTTSESTGYRNRPKTDLSLTARGSGTFGCRNRSMFLNNDDDGRADEFIQKWCPGVPPLCCTVPLHLFTLIRDYEILKEARQSTVYGSLFMSAVLQCSEPAWERIALGVQRALRVQREVIFPAGELMPVSLPELARVPYLGWVGPRFRGTVIVGKNPGGGGDSQTDVKPHDRAVADALLALKSAAEGRAGVALRGVYDAFTAQAPTIGMGTLRGSVLEALGEAREEVAFLNLCPFRTRMDKDPSVPAARRSGSLVLAPLIDALQADTVVLMGGVAGRAAPELQARWVYKLKRRINDYQLHPEAAQRLEEMRASRGDRAAFRASRAS